MRRCPSGGTPSERAPRGAPADATTTHSTAIHARGGRAPSTTALCGPPRPTGPVARSVPPGRRGQWPGIDLDGGHRLGRAHQVGEESGGPAGAGTDVQHAVAARGSKVVQRSRDQVRGRRGTGASVPVVGRRAGRERSTAFVELGHDDRVGADGAPPGIGVGVAVDPVAGCAGRCPSLGGDEVVARDGEYRRREAGRRVHAVSCLFGCTDTHPARWGWNGRDGRSLPRPP
jgi:hypothetical protein